MDTALKVIGGIWALIGIGSIFVGMYSAPSSPGVPTVGIAFNVGLFVIPGFIIYGIGAGMSRKRMAGKE